MSNEVQVVQKAGKVALDTAVNNKVALGWSLCGYPFELAGWPAQLMLKTGLLPVVPGEYRLVHKPANAAWNTELTALTQAGWKVYGQPFEVKGMGYQAMIKGEISVGQGVNSDGPSFTAFGGRSTGVTTVIIGDSITANGFLSDGVVSHNALGPVYSGTFARTEDYGYAAWADVLSDGGLGNYINAGIGGNTTQDIFARKDTDVLAHRPQQVIDESGTNNVIANQSAATIIASKQALFDEYRKIGARIIAFDIAPRSLFTTTQRDVARDVNRWLYSLATTQPDIAVFSMASLLADYASPTGGVSAARTFDDTHPNNVGGFYIGKGLADFIKPSASLQIKGSMWPGDAYGSSSASAVIRNSNPGMAYTTGGVMNTGVTGQIADGYTCSRLSGAATVVGSIVPRDDGLGFSQRLVITFAAANDSIEFGIPAGTSRYLPSRKLGIQAKLEFIAGSSDVINRCMLYTSPVIAGQTYQVTAMNQQSATRRGNLPVSSGNVKGWFRSPRLQMPAGAATAWSTQLRIYASAPGTVTLDLSQFAMTLHP
jgi:lysophospholipase L1-like esterase